ncbi:hypothetical protein IT072_20705 (plasmid) [Leifsonia sp. ZF2019]|uniref:hypothetical protein n=1 Tax=Leifsonia sp. ZF2019 TaxID=2781978 RepID=UPI001CBAC5A5|nr:hypothetical protein [Leifsonia sp. ZF2019]UAJ81768.1 hypothetical protein IT072_20705 [Leifsonia sp. ZF2019]
MREQDTKPENAETRPEPVKASKTTEQRLGLVGLVLAIIAFIFAFIPILSFTAWLPAAAALTITIYSLIAKNHHTRVTWVSLIIAAVAWVVAIIVSVMSIMSGASFLFGRPGLPIFALPAGTTTVQYDVTIDNGTIDRITYADPSIGHSGDNFQPATVNYVQPAAPFRKKIDADKRILTNETTYKLVASTDKTGGTIFCTITVDGKIISQQKATGPHATADCSATR